MELEELDVLELVSAPGDVVLGDVVDVAEDSVEPLGGGVVRVVDSSTPAPRATTQNTVSNLLIMVPPRWGVPSPRRLRYAERLVNTGHTAKENSQ